MNSVKTAAQKFVSNPNVQCTVTEDQIRFVIDLSKEAIWTGGDGHWSTVVKGVKCKTLELKYTKVEEIPEGEVWKGGFAGNLEYDGSGNDTWNDGTDLDTGVLLNRMPGQDSDGLIYSDKTFKANVIKYLEQHCDFDTALLEYFDFDYSEQGMQEEENINFDVFMNSTLWKEVA